VADMRNLLGSVGDSGSLTDLGSVKRLSLIWDFQNADAHAFASYKAGMDPDILDAFPAQRLVRVESRRVPRQWLQRWGAAGAAVGWNGASSRTMVALKTSPIWAKLSRFERPWPPFDFNSGMGLEDVDRQEAEDLKLLPKGESPADRMQKLREQAAKMQKDWNDGLAASAKNLTPEAQTWLKDAFGDQVSIEGDTINWKAESGMQNEEIQKSDTEPEGRSEEPGDRGQEANSEPAPLWQSLTDTAPETVPQALSEPAAVEVNAVQAGTKPVYHEQVGDELARDMVTWLRAQAGETLDVWTREGHVFARRPDGPSRHEIETRLMSGAGGELLGYGAETMFAPGNVPVGIFDSDHKVVAGFFAPADRADELARARVADWVAATGKKFFYEVKR